MTILPGQRIRAGPPDPRDLVDPVAAAVMMMVEMADLVRAGFRVRHEEGERHGQGRSEQSFHGCVLSGVVWF